MGEATENSIISYIFWSLNVDCLGNVKGKDMVWSTELKSRKSLISFRVLLRGDQKVRGPRTFWISELEEVYEVLRRDRGEAAVWVVRCARMSRVLRWKERISLKHFLRKSLQHWLVARVPSSLLKINSSSEKPFWVPQRGFQWTVLKITLFS